MGRHRKQPTENPNGKDPAFQAAVIALASCVNTFVPFSKPPAMLTIRPRNSELRWAIPKGEGNMGVRKLRMLSAAGDETLAEWDVKTVAPERLAKIEAEFKTRMQQGFFAVDMTDG